jgi:DNA-binding Xre family transcriptional regulator
MIKYNKLFALLALRGMQKIDLYEVIGPPTVTKLAQNKSVTTPLIDRICCFLNVQPGDIMEYVPDEAEGQGGD